MRAIIVANGQIEPGERYDTLSGPHDCVVTADGGAALALRLGLQPNAVIGDMDSLPAQVRAYLEGKRCTFVQHPARKNETDLELAIRYALQQGATEIVLLGVLGGRLDHALANISLLGMPELAGVRAFVDAGRTRVWLVRDALEIAGKPGDIVSLLPLGQDAVEVRTEGLEYVLRGETLRFGPARGVSNVMNAAVARITLQSGLLLACHLRSEGQAAVSPNTEER